MTPKKIKVLHIVGSMYPGGMENFVMNIFEKIDKEKYQFDFAVHAIKENGYDKRIEELGSKIYLLPRLSSHPLASLKELKRVIVEGQYDVVVRHTPNALIAPQLMVAKKAGAITVCQSHSENDSAKLVHNIGKMLLKKCVDYRLACSVKAGQWMYGASDFQIVKNGIDIDKFEFSQEKSNRIREELNVSKSQHIYGHIGNFFIAKNHLFLMEVFNEISKIEDDAIFVCVGDGELRPEIENKIKELKIEDKVILAGRRMNANDFMSAFDMLIFPSIYEGLPLTLIEAQIAGLPITMSSNITDDVIITEGLVQKISLEENATIWAKLIVQSVNQKSKDRVCQKQKIQEEGYDLKQLVDWYENFLSGITKEK